jgi:hypothetical protein
MTNQRIPGVDLRVHHLLSTCAAQCLATCREHSVQVEVHAREPPSKLQEAFKESTKVDAEYNLPTWVPKTGVNKTKRRIPGVVQATFRQHAANERKTRKEKVNTPDAHIRPHAHVVGFDVQCLAVRV